MENSSFENLKKKVLALLDDGKTLDEVSKEIGVPNGSVRNVIAKLGIDVSGYRFSYGYFSDRGRKSVSESLKKRHADGLMPHGETHWLHSKMMLRGSFVDEEMVRLELEHYVEKDLTIADMAEAMGVDRKTITNRLKKFGIQRGIRSGERCSWFCGGHKRDRSKKLLDIKAHIIDRDGYKCQMCGITQDDALGNGHGLCAHHIVPSNAGGSDDDENLITLCQSCHMKEEWANGRLRKKQQ